MIIFRITEMMARYRVSATALSVELDVTKGTVSQWRHGSSKPSLDRLDDIMDAIAKLGDKQQLNLFPLRLSDVLEWTTENTKV